MEYINSAGVKLPNADIIIEADEAGTVTSCRNAATGEEFSINEVNLTVINNTTGAKSITLINRVPNPEDGRYYYISQSNSTPANSTKTFKVIAPTRVSKVTAMTNFEGDCYVSGSYIFCYGDCAITY